MTRRTKWTKTVRKTDETSETIAFMACGVRCVCSVYLVSLVIWSFGQRGEPSKFELHPVVAVVHRNLVPDVY